MWRYTVDGTPHKAVSIFRRRQTMRKAPELPTETIIESPARKQEGSGFFAFIAVLTLIVVALIVANVIFGPSPTFTVDPEMLTGP
jgi:hypothetical protein